MKDILTGVAIFVIGIIMALGIGFIGFKGYEFYAPKYRAVDNAVFKESEQYNDGMVRDLENLQMEYVNADQAHKDALRSIVLHRFSVYPQDKMPSNLRNFYNDLKAGK